MDEEKETTIKGDEANMSLIIFPIFIPTGSRGGSYDAWLEDMDRDPELRLLLMSPLFVLWRNSIYVLFGLIKEIIKGAKND